jgi:diacylglycerol kinase family enzyme
MAEKSMMRLGLIVNPRALGVQKDAGLTARLREILLRARVSGALYETRSQRELEEALSKMARQGTQVVAVCGGDGTHLMTLSTLRRTFSQLPKVAILRGGTVNTIAQNLRISGTPEQLLERLVGALEQDRVGTVTQDLIEVERPGAAPLTGFLFASLMGSRFLEAYYGGISPGRTWATFLAARTVGSSLLKGPFSKWLFEPTPAEIHLDGRPRDEVAAPRLLIASTVRDVGIGMKVSWQAGREPGRFHFLASGLSTPKMALQLHRVLAGHPLAGKPHLDELASRAELRFSTPQTFTLDGELFRSAEVAIRIGPALEVVTFPR